jgi:hypothetical protein
LVSFIFVPGHAGVRGNERADRLARTAAISDGRAMDHADVLYPFVRGEEWRTHLEIKSRALWKDREMVRSSLVRPDMNNTLAVKDE